MGKRRRDREIVTINGFNIELNNVKNPVKGQNKKIIEAIDSFVLSNKK